MLIEDILIDGQNVDKADLRDYLADRTTDGTNFVCKGTDTPTTVTPHYGFRDESTTEILANGAPPGQASFAAARVVTGAGDMDHVHAFQDAQETLNNTGDLTYYRGYASYPVFNGPGDIQSVYLHAAESPSGTGTVTDELIGFYCGSLSRPGTISVLAFNSVGPTPSRFDGAVYSRSRFVVNLDGSDSVGVGPFVGIGNAAGDRTWYFQLNAANEIDAHNYNGSSFRVPVTFNRTGIRIPHGSAPASPVDGDVWSTTTAMFHRINGVTKQVAYV